MTEGLGNPWLCGTQEAAERKALGMGNLGERVLFLPEVLTVLLLCPPMAHIRASTTLGVGGGPLEDL